MRQMKIQKELLIKVLLFVILVICFSLQSLEGFNKFIEGRTSISESLITQDAKPLPTLTICSDPPFDQNLMENQMKISPYLFFLSSGSASNQDFDFPANLSENFQDQNSLMGLWNFSSLRPDTFGIGNDLIFRDEFQMYGGSTKKYQISNSLWFGGCVQITPFEPKPAHAIFMVGIMWYKPVKPDKFRLILHETPGTAFSIFPGDFLSPGSKIEEVYLGQMKMIGINKRQKIYHIQRKNGACKEYGEMDSQAKCKLENEILPRFQNETLAREICVARNKNISKLCLIPQAMNLKYLDQNLSNLPLCTTEEDYKCMLTLLSPDIQENDQKCRHPCTETFYETYSRSNPHPSKNWAYVMMYYQSNRIQVLEEYLVFDFSSILVAIGGSLGLFLGFSFFQCCQSVTSGIINMSRETIYR